MFHSDKKFNFYFILIFYHYYYYYFYCICTKTKVNMFLSAAFKTYLRTNAVALSPFFNALIRHMLYYRIWVLKILLELVLKNSS
jgi:hypothetical protein